MRFISVVVALLDSIADRTSVLADVVLACARPTAPLTASGLRGGV
jgi:hypothetical protein